MYKTSCNFPEEFSWRSEKLLIPIVTCNSISPVKQSRVCITLEKFCWIINFCWLIMNKKKKLTSIITNVKVVFYVKNVSDKMTFYKKFEGQNTATERLCDVCFGSLRYLKFVAHSMMCVFVKILLRKILRRILNVYCAFCCTFCRLCLNYFDDVVRRSLKRSEMLLRNKFSYASRWLHLRIYSFLSKFCRGLFKSVCKSSQPCLSRWEGYLVLFQLRCFSRSL